LTDPEEEGKTKTNGGLEKYLRRHTAKKSRTRLKKNDPPAQNVLVNEFEENRLGLVAVTQSRGKKNVLVGEKNRGGQKGVIGLSPDPRKRRPFGV